MTGGAPRLSVSNRRPGHRKGTVVRWNDETTPWDRHHSARLAAMGLPSQPFPPESSDQFANLYERLMSGWDAVHDRALPVSEFVDLAVERAARKAGTPNRAPQDLLAFAVDNGWKYLEACRILVETPELAWPEDVLIGSLVGAPKSWFARHWPTLADWYPFQRWLETHADQNNGVWYTDLQPWFAAQGYVTNDKRTPQRLCSLFGYVLLDTSGRPYRFDRRRKG